MYFGSLGGICATCLITVLMSAAEYLGERGERGGLVWRSNGDQIFVGIFFFFFGLEIVNASYVKIHR